MNNTNKNIAGKLSVEKASAFALGGILPFPGRLGAEEDKTSKSAGGLNR